MTTSANNSITNVFIDYPQDDDVLTWNAATARWINKPIVASFPPAGAVDTFLTTNSAGVVGFNPILIGSNLSGDGISTPINSNPIVTDATLTGNGEAGTPLSVVAPGGGTVAIVSNTADFTGLGTTASPLDLITQPSSTVGAWFNPLLTVNSKGVATAIQSPSNIGMNVQYTQTIANSPTVSNLSAGTQTTVWPTINGLGFNSTTGTWTCTVRSGFIFYCAFTVNWGTSAAGTFRRLQILQTSTSWGTNVIARSQIPAAASTYSSCSNMVMMNIGDTINFQMVQDSGATMSVVGNATITPVLST
jgi:hypothetical protein